jgi:hypothetical protein
VYARKLVASLVVLLVLLATACQGYESGARERFSKQFTCPEDRVEVRPSALTVAAVKARKRAEPPPEIKADPGRLKLWQEEQDKTASFSSAFCTELWEARGCDHHTLYCCYRPSKHANQVSCSSEDYPAGAPKF